MTTIHLENNTVLLSFWEKLRRFLSLAETLPQPIPLPAPLITPLEEPVRQSLQQRFPDERLQLDVVARSAYCTPRNYPEFVQRMQGYPAPQAVLYPGTEQELADLLLWAAKRDIALWNWPSKMPPAQTDEQPIRSYLIVDLIRMNRVLEVNENKNRIRVQAGLSWAALQTLLMEKELTTGIAFIDDELPIGTVLGHNLLNINALGSGYMRCAIHALRGMTPAGPLVLERPLPGQADMRGLLLGAQQQFGILTEATFNLRPALPDSHYLLVSFASWDKAIAALRRLLPLEEGLIQAAILSTDELTLFSAEPSTNWVQNLRSRLTAPTPRVAHLALKMAGPKDSIAKKRQHLEAPLKDSEESVDINNKGSAVLNQVHAQRKTLLPELWVHGVLAHTVEATVPWADAAAFRSDWEEALQSILQATGETRGLTLTTLYATQEEAVLHTLLLGTQAPVLSRAEQLQAIEAVAQETQRRWGVYNAPSALLTQAAQAVRQVLDPFEVLLR